MLPCFFEYSRAKKEKPMKKESAKKRITFFDGTLRPPRKALKSPWGSPRLRDPKEEAPAGALRAFRSDEATRFSVFISPVLLLRFSPLSLPP